MVWDKEKFKIEPLTKTYISFGLVILALFEFWAAMQIFGKSPPSASAALIMRLHRIFGYVFLVYFIWISGVCVDMMGRLSQEGKHLDFRGFFHGFLALSLLTLLVLKLSFIRIYQNFRSYAQSLGMILAAGTIVLWGIAGWMFLIIMK